MTLVELQTALKASGRYYGAIDGAWGRLTEAAVLLAMSDGPDTLATAADFTRVAGELGIRPSVIRAFWKVEAAGAPFFDGRPKILPERHYFSKLTTGRYDKLYPRISYPVWGTLPYPKTQDQRYDLLLAMVSLDVNAGFSSCSYGAPQIMGANYRLCGYRSAFEFAAAMARDEVTQLRAFAAFVTAIGLLPHLRAAGRSVDSWAAVARRYNGPAFAANQYDVKMRDAYLEYERNG